MRVRRDQEMEIVPEIHVPVMVILVVAVVALVYAILAYNARGTDDLEVTRAKLALNAVGADQLDEAGDFAMNSLALTLGDVSAGAAHPHKWAVAYTPTEFATAVATTVLPLMAEPGKAAATTHAGGCFKLPDNAFILKAFFLNGGTAVVGATSFDLGHTSAGTTSSSVTLFDNVLLDTLNAGALVMPTTAQAPTVVLSAFGTAGHTIEGNANSETVLKTVHVAGDSFVTVTVNGGPITAGNAKLILEYIVL